MPVLQIITSAQVPNGTYFRTSDAEPTLENNTLTIYGGTGTRRSSWGAPGVTSTIVLQSEDIIAIHVGFFHKHGGGQFWRYYRQHNDQWQQVAWAQLSDEDRQIVLTAYDEQKAPAFAKIPGKLRTQHKKPEMKTLITYKLVQVIDDHYYSVYDGMDTEYVLGKRLAEKAMDEHGGGYYSYPNAVGVEKRFVEGSLFPSRCYDQSMQLVLIECEISGTIISYDGKKYASTYIKPLRELKQFQYAPALAS